MSLIHSSVAVTDGADHLGASLLVRDCTGDYRPAKPEEVIAAARRVLSRRVRKGTLLTSPQDVRSYLAVQLGLLEHEVFAVIFVDAQHRLIRYQEMFRGTLTQTSV
ncbi:MAG: hypothetical protein RLY71_1838 [Pseudomonadota bacterium]